jgi:hypothetical protein
MSDYTILKGNSNQIFFYGCYKIAKKILVCGNALEQPGCLDTELLPEYSPHYP